MIITNHSALRLKNVFLNAKKSFNCSSGPQPFLFRGPVSEQKQYREPVSTHNTKTTVCRFDALSIILLEVELFNCDLNTSFSFSSLLPLSYHPQFCFPRTFVTSQSIDCYFTSEPSLQVCHVYGISNAESLLQMSVGLLVRVVACKQNLSSECIKL